MMDHDRFLLAGLGIKEHYGQDGLDQTITYSICPATVFVWFGTDRGFLGELDTILFLFLLLWGRALFCSRWGHCWMIFSYSSHSSALRGGGLVISQAMLLGTYALSTTGLRTYNLTFPRAHLIAEVEGERKGGRSEWKQIQLFLLESDRRWRGTVFYLFMFHSYVD